MSTIHTLKEKLREEIADVMLLAARKEAGVVLTTDDVIRLVKAGAIGKGGEIFLLDMGKPVKIIDLARELITLSGHTPDVDIPITITGIRPGEKIFEELLTAEEGPTATMWEKIFISKTQNHLTHERLATHLRAVRHLFEHGAPSRDAAAGAIDAFFSEK